jgi:hypothetical protein
MQSSNAKIAIIVGVVCFEARILLVCVLSLPQRKLFGHQMTEADNKLETTSIWSSVVGKF